MSDRQHAVTSTCVVSSERPRQRKKVRHLPYEHHDEQRPRTWI